MPLKFMPGNGRPGRVPKLYRHQIQVGIDDALRADVEFLAALLKTTVNDAVRLALRAGIDNIISRQER